MASFSDSNLPQYKPYVSEMPPEIFHEVGQQKQQQYNQGVQLVQNQINNVAGLDVLRPIDKDYLHSKLNELGNNITGFLASDFSDNQLVNSVSGMASSVAKDGRIQNAVYSTQKFRDEAANMKQAQKDGKSSPENELWFNKQAESYLNNTDPNATFNGRYVPYKDLNEKGLKVLKSLVEEGAGKEHSIESMFTTDKDGKSTTTYADAMQKVIESGIPKEKIEAALRASLDEGDMQQLQISSAYHYRDYDGQRMLNETTSNFNSKVAYASDMITKLSAKALMYKNDTQNYNDTVASINYYNNLIAKGGTLEQQYNQQIDNINKDVDATKFSLYKEAFINEFSNAHDTQKRSVEFLTNPGVTQQNWRADFGLKTNQFRETMRHNQVEEGIQGKRLEIEADKLALDKIKKQKELTGELGHTAYGALPTDVSKMTENLQNEINSDNQTYDEKLKSLTKTLNEQAAANFSSDKTLKQYTIGGITYDANHPITSEQAIAAIKNYYDDPNISKNAIPKDIKKYVTDLVSLRQSAMQKQNLLTSTRKEAESDPVLTTLAKKLDKSLQESYGLVDTKSGQKYSSEELLNYFSKVTNPINVKNVGDLSDAFDEGVLTENEKKLHQSYIPPQIRQHYLSLSDEYSKIQNQIISKQQEILSKRIPNYVPKLTEIVVGDNDNARQHYLSIGINKAKLGEQGKIGYEGLDSKTIQDWQADEKTRKQLMFNVYSTGNRKYLQITNPSSKEEQLVPLESSDVGQLPIAQPGPTEEIKKSMIMSKTGTTTNASGNSDPSTAFIQPTDLYSVRKYKVAADINSVLGSETEGYPVIHVQINNSWKDIPISATESSMNPDGSLNLADAKAYILSLDDKKIQDLVKLHLPQDYSSLIKK